MGKPQDIDQSCPHWVSSLLASFDSLVYFLILKVPSNMIAENRPLSPELSAPRSLLRHGCLVRKVDDFFDVKKGDRLESCIATQALRRRLLGQSTDFLDELRSVVVRKDSEMTETAEPTDEESLAMATFLAGTHLLTVSSTPFISKKGVKAEEDNDDDDSTSNSSQSSISSSDPTLSRSDHSTCTTTSRRVRFSHIERREYSITLGDHPLTDQLPLSLDWEHTATQMFNLDEVESIKREKGGTDEPKRMSLVERRLRLLRVTGLKPVRLLMLEREREKTLREEELALNQEHAMNGNCRWN